MKKMTSKLGLSRETLMPLTGDDLDGVHGGTSSLPSVPVTFTVTLASSIPCARQAVQPVKQAISRAVCPQLPPTNPPPNR